jgi:RNA recognition motif-containing protein
MKIYISNLSFHTTNDTLTALFEKFGTVSSTRVITDRETGRNRGFAFVEMATDDEAQKAIHGLDNKEIEGRALSVSVARK